MGNCKVLWVGLLKVSLNGNDSKQGTIEGILNGKCTCLDIANLGCTLDLANYYSNPASLRNGVSLAPEGLIGKIFIVREGKAQGGNCPSPCTGRKSIPIRIQFSVAKSFNDVMKEHSVPTGADSKEKLNNMNRVEKLFLLKRVEKAAEAFVNMVQDSACKEVEKVIDAGSIYCGEQNGPRTDKLEFVDR